MAGAVVLALDNNAVAGIVVAVDEQRQEECDEEEDAVHDTERKARLQHRAGLVCRKIDSVSGHGEEAQVETVGIATGCVGAVPAGDFAKLVHSTDEGAHEQEIDESNEAGGVLSASVEEECANCPSSAQNRDDEQNEDRPRRKLIAICIWS